jgi:hypothetical protein
LFLGNFTGGEFQINNHSHCIHYEKNGFRMREFDGRKLHAACPIQSGLRVSITAYANAKCAQLLGKLIAFNCTSINYQPVEWDTTQLPTIAQLENFSRSKKGWIQRERLSLAQHLERISCNESVTDTGASLPGKHQQAFLEAICRREQHLKEVERQCDIRMHIPITCRLPHESQTRMLDNDGQGTNKTMNASEGKADTGSGTGTEVPGGKRKLSVKRNYTESDPASTFLSARSKVRHNMCNVDL